jgi:hypothetical protein
MKLSKKGEKIVLILLFILVIIVFIIIFCLLYPLTVQRFLKSSLSGYTDTDTIFIL